MHFALIGHNLEYSLSPVIHSAVYNALGINAKYGIISVPKGGLKTIMPALQELDGFNVTQPHKEDIIPFLEKNNSSIGAVNTVKCDGGKLIGCNTDLNAFSSVTNEPLSKLKGGLAVVEGAGGMARAAIFALKKHTDNIFIINRSTVRGQALAKEMGVSYAEPTQILKPKIYINCSSKELHGGGFEFAKIIDPSQIEYAFDAIYFETEFIRLCRKMQVRCDNGLDMLILQAILADEIFLNKKLECEKLIKTVKDIIGMPVK